jgi:adenosine kinase
MEILVSGSLAYDRIMDFPGKFSDHILPDKIHILNVCFMVNGLKEKFGGTAGNIAYNLALLGERPLILATAGKDFDRYREWLLGQGLSLEGIRIVPEEFTAGAYITTDLADNQITGFNPGAMKHASGFRPNAANSHRRLAIVAPGSIEDMVTYSRAYRTAGTRFICDPGQSIPALSGAQLTEMIAGAELLISNDYEREMIQQKTGLGVDELLARAGAIITTLGEKGSLVLTRQEEVHVPAAKADGTKDPTGAGDAYRAGLIKGLAMERDLREAARMGSTCASFAVERLGTQEHRFTLETFWERHRSNFGISAAGQR